MRTAPYPTCDCPKGSPWGEVWSWNTQPAPGVFIVATGGHGGVMVAPEVAEEVLSPAARREAQRYHGWYCFEEDMKAAIPAWEIPALANPERARGWLYGYLAETFPRYVRASGAQPPAQEVLL